MVIFATMTTILAFMIAIFETIIHVMKAKTDALVFIFPIFK